MQPTDNNPSARAPVRGAGLRGTSRLVFDAVEQITGIVEGMHANIAAAPLPFGKGTDGRTRGITGFVYDSIRRVNGTVSLALDSVFGLLPAEIAPDALHAERNALLAAANGVLGDHLHATGNPLAIPMHLRSQGTSLWLEREALAAAFHATGGKLLVLVHGLCMNDLQWLRNGHDHGASLARELGYTPAYLHYNSGRHISHNGREFAQRLEQLVDQWPVPVEDLTIVAHSMGGLVTRSAHHYGTAAAHRWPSRLRRIVFLGTPHHGAPLERRGNWLQTIVGFSPYTSPLSRLGMLRSAGVTDLRYGNLLDEDWEKAGRFEHNHDRRAKLGLPAGVDCYTIAATTGLSKGDLKDRLLADGLVPVSSALGKHPDPGRRLDFPESRQWVGYGMSHWDLLDRPEVYEKLKAWLM